MGIIKEMKTFSFGVFLEEPIVHCKEFQDNYGAIELSRLPKICLGTKHINVVFHQLCEYTCKVHIHLQQVSMDY